MRIPPNTLTFRLFIIYLLVLTWILLFKLGVNFTYMNARSVNLVPFHGSLDLPELILNLVIFVPLGIYVGVLFEGWTLVKKFSFFFLVSLVIEVVQFVLAIGAFDITDIIMNTVGGIIGFIIVSIIGRIFSNPTKAHQFINTVAAIGTLAIVALLFLLKLNLLPLRYQ